MSYIISLDEGTTSCRAILFNENGDICGVEQQEFEQIYPKNGWVEHDAEVILSTQIKVVKDLISNLKVNTSDIKGIGITNQRETTVVWNKKTGKPIYNAIVWQCRRTAEYCQNLKDKGYSQKIKNKTGLVVDAYFSGSKIKWILENVEGAREQAERGELAFGTIDTWLIWHLTNGEVHATDYSNASRTMLFNIHTLEWDEEIIKLMGIPKSMLPKVYPSSHLFGHTNEEVIGFNVPIAGVAGDQQAALFGQLCTNVGNIKTTYGTGCFLLQNTGNEAINSEKGLLTTIAWGLKGEVTYALEGSIFMAGASIQWLRDNLGIIQDAKETEAMALSVDSTEGTYFIPAFQGLGTPYWEMDAKASIMGMTRKSKKEHIVRAALESIAYRVRDVIEVMEEESHKTCQVLKVDGGASRNKFLTQFQSDLLNIPVVKPKNIETTALGAAFLAGLEVGIWEDIKALRAIWAIDHIYEPILSEDIALEKYNGWKHMISKTI